MCWPVRLPRAPRRLVSAAFAALIAGTLAAPSFADVSEADKVRVQAAYEEGKALMAEGRAAEACAAFERGERIDPSAVSLRLRLAECYVATGKVASAFRTYQDVARVARATGHPKAAEASEGAIALASKVAFVTIEVAPDHTPGLVVTRDGVPLEESVWGQTIAVDPGPVRVEARAPHHQGFFVSMMLVEGEPTRVIRIPTLAPEAGDEPKEPTKPLEEPTLGTQRTVAIVAGAVGLVGVGVGSVYGLSALGKLDDARNGHCNADDVCDDEGIRLREEAETAGTASTAAFCVGGGVIAAGLILWLTADDGKPPVVAQVAPAKDGFWAGLSLSL